MSKTCSWCHQVKTLTEFGRNARRPDGLNIYCKLCVNQISREVVRRRLATEAGRASYRASKNTQRTRRLARDREQIFAHYGQVCACCGSTEKLTIDHIDGQGRRHRRELFGTSASSSKFYRWLVRSGFPPGFQVLCSACNSSKARGEHCRMDHNAPPRVRVITTGRPTCPTCGHVIGRDRARKIQGAASPG